MFELLVRDAKLFLLRLELLTLTLGLFEQLLQPAAIAGRADRDRDRLRDAIQDIDLRRIDCMEKAQLCDGVHRTVDARGRDDELAGLCAAHCRRDTKVVRRQVVQVNRPILLRRLAGEALTEMQRRASIRRRFERVTRDSTQPLTRFGHVHSADLGIQVLHQHAEDLLANGLDPQVALHLCV